jgi:phospholipid transport system substrate-binding protein
MEALKDRLAVSFAIVLYLCVLSGAVSQPVSNDAETVVRQLTDRIYRVLLEQCGVIQERPERLYSVVDDLLLPHTDLEKMSQWVLAKYWREADSDQRREFEQQFWQLLVRTYATAIQTVAPENIHFLPTRDMGRSDRALVRTEIRQPGEAVIAIDYPMYRKQERWLVYDVRVEGVSLVTSYRTTFADKIRDKGVSGLIALLKRQNQASMTADTAEHIRSLQARHCPTKKP